MDPTNSTITQGGAKVQEALYIYQELGERFNWTVRLHNGAAVAHMKMGSFEEAEQLLLEAYDKNPKDPDTLANLYVCGLHLSKNVARYLTCVVCCAHCATTLHADTGSSRRRRRATRLSSVWRLQTERTMWQQLQVFELPHFVIVCKRISHIAFKREARPRSLLPLEHHQPGIHQSSRARSLPPCVKSSGAQ